MTEQILVTGGAGFIGSSFIKFALANRRDYRIHARSFTPTSISLHESDWSGLYAMSEVIGK